MTQALVEAHRQDLLRASTMPRPADAAPARRSRLAGILAFRRAPRREATTAAPVAQSPSQTA